MIFGFWLWLPFGSHFGGFLGAQMEANAIKKALQTNHQNADAQHEPKLVPKGILNGANIIKHEVLEAPCFNGGSQVASRGPPGSILDSCWDHFGTMFVSFLTYFVVFFARIL